MKLILSTLSSANTICFTSTTGSGAKVITKRITIKGGANVVDKRTISTPLGVVTELSDADYADVISTDWYKRMNARGFVRPVECYEDAEDPNKKGMCGKDKSAQKTDKDLRVSGKTGKVED